MEDTSLRLDSFEVLDHVDGRAPCERCKGVSRRYFCYTCCRPMPKLEGKLPAVALPVNVHIIRHPKEKHGKSTGVQCAILAQENVRLFLYPDFPDYRNENAILIFPDPKAPTLQSLAETSAANEKNKAILQKIKDATTFVFIDCTWFQTGGMRKHEKLRSVPVLPLDGHRTRYWRPQHNEPDGCLATVEAVYYFCLDYEKYVLSKNAYDGCYDNLLYFFEYFRRKVECEESARKRRRVEREKK